MKQLNLKIGTMYIEEFEDREEDDRIKLYDSEHRYFDHIGISVFKNYDNETQKEFYNMLIQELMRFETIDELLNQFGIFSYSASTEWSNLLEDIYGIEDIEFNNGKWFYKPDNTEITKDIILGNEWVNVIGNSYIFITEE